MMMIEVEGDEEMKRMELEMMEEEEEGKMMTIERESLGVISPPISPYKYLLLQHQHHQHL